ncbi:zinc finger protein 236-like [Symsagittifera roscoffensis]|uniref:zinc finger protein 236-like n=1 Tax=Symsagittifera roscoffensis TaxID=84072 RepID=UPI00307BB78D
MSESTDQSQLSNSLQLLIQSLSSNAETNQNSSLMTIKKEAHEEESSPVMMEEEIPQNSFASSKNPLETLVSNLDNLISSQQTIKKEPSMTNPADTTQNNQLLANVLANPETLALFQQMLIAQKLQSSISSSLEGASGLIMNPLFMSLLQNQLTNNQQTSCSGSSSNENSRKGTNSDDVKIPIAPKPPSKISSSNAIAVGIRSGTKGIKVGSKARLTEPFLTGASHDSESCSMVSESCTPSASFMDQMIDSPTESQSDESESASGSEKLLRKGGKEVAKFQCGDCSFVTSKLYVFNQHVATHKNNEKEHECPICKQKFKYKQSVKKHMMKHEGITPYHCKICDYKTNSHSSLEVHQRAHSGEKPFVCESCGMRFAQNSQLRVHIQYHSNANNPYKCELCDYQSPNYYKLTRHMKVHRERPYACDLCKKRFMLPYQLRNHAATHTKTAIKGGNIAIEEDEHVMCVGCNVVYRDQEKFNYHVKECPKLNNGSLIPGTSRSMKDDVFKISKKPKSDFSKASAGDNDLGVNVSEKSETVTMTTKITHPDKTVSRILHIPAKNQIQQSTISAYSGLSKQTSRTESRTTQESALEIAQSDEEEHLEMNEQDYFGRLEGIGSTMNLPDDVVIIKPEAAPSDISTSSSNIWDFGVQIPNEDSKIKLNDYRSAFSTAQYSARTNSEHSTSPGSSFVSPSADKIQSPLEPTFVDAIQNQMSSIFDNLLFKAESDCQDQSSRNDSGALNMTRTSINQGSQESDDEEALDLTMDQNADTTIDNQDINGWDLSKPNVSSAASEPLNLSLSPVDLKEPASEVRALIAKPIKVLSEEEAIIKTDNAERPFKCGYCSKQFIQSSHIRVHLQYHVNAGNPFKCPDCSYTSASKYKLNLHVKVHKERRFQCPYCSSKFTLNCRLNQHIKLAHGENLPYKCTLCNVTFSSTNLLSWHVANKHSHHVSNSDSSLLATSCDESHLTATA